jgi:hypothetical protein
MVDLIQLFQSYKEWSCSECSFFQTKVSERLQVAVERSVLETVLHEPVGMIDLLIDLAIGLNWKPLFSVLVVADRFHGRRNLLLLHAAVLEPDFDLTLRKTQNFGKAEAPWSANISEKYKNK